MNTISTIFVIIVIVVVIVFYIHRALTQDIFYRLVKYCKVYPLCMRL